MNQLGLISDIATGSAIGVWLSCYVFTSESLKCAAQTQIEPRFGGRR